MKKKKINSNNLLLLITIVLFFVMYAAGCIVYADKGFTRFQTFLNILINNAGLICITAGMTCVMLTGGIDISVGSIVAMDCMILAVGIEQWGWSSPVLMLLILVIGIVFDIEYTAVNILVFFHGIKIAIFLECNYNLTDL